MQFGETIVAYSNNYSEALRQLKILVKITQQPSNYMDIHLCNYCNKSNIKL